MMIMTTPMIMMIITRRTAKGNRIGNFREKVPTGQCRKEAGNNGAYNATILSMTMIGYVPLAIPTQ